MADPDHVKVFHRGVDAWNRWRSKHRGTQPDLSQADLSRSNLRLANFNNANLRHANLEGANLGRAYLEAAELEGARQRGVHLFGADLGRADLRHTDLAEAQLWNARLAEADLREADLRRADLRSSDLSGADLRGASLEDAVLDGALLFSADLSGACLAGTRLHRAQLWDCRLDAAELAGAVLAHTALNNLDLSRTVGIGSAEHEEPSSLGIDTLERTALGLRSDPAQLAEVEAFLRGAGVRESYLDIFQERIGHSCGYYSAFIRYSRADQDFARRIYDELQARGIRCWLHEHPMLPGDDVHEELGLGPWDRLLLLVSEASCTSWWIGAEMAKVDELEAGAMVPVNLDGYLTGGHWESAEAEAIRSRLAADFSGSAAAEGPAFDRELERLAEALRMAAPMSPESPGMAV